MWYYFENGQRMGPVSFEEIVNLIHQGVITQTTYVCQAGKMRQTAGMLPELSSYFFGSNQYHSNSSTTSSTAQPDACKNEQDSSVTKPSSRKRNKVTSTFKNTAGDSSAMEGFSLKKLFSETFKKHTDEEMENYFGVGTPLSTPPLSQVNSSWPTPWFFWRLVLFGLAGFFILWTGYERWNNPNCAFGAIFFGSFAIPIASVMFFYECNVLKNVSLYKTIKLFLFGGIFGLLLTLIGFNFILALIEFNFIPFTELGPPKVSIVEESAKLLVLIIVLKMGWLLDKDYILNGLLFGAVVGAGFAAFESAVCAFTIYDGETLHAGKEMLTNKVLYGSNDPKVAMYINLILRGMLAPFGHIIWTAMSAAALWKVKGDKELEFSMLFKPTFLFTFILAIGLHMTWNSELNIGFYPRFTFLGAIGWIAIFGMMGFGLKQVRDDQRMLN